MSPAVAVTAVVAVAVGLVVALRYALSEESPDYVSEATRQRLMAQFPGGCAYLGQPRRGR